MSEQELFDALVRLCQDFGITNDETYDLLHSAIETITPDTETADDGE